MHAHRYRIIIGGGLSTVVRRAFAEFKIDSNDGYTTLIADLDQAALHGALHRIQALALDFIAGREVRFDDRAASGWVSEDAQAAFLESLQCLAVAAGNTAFRCTLSCTSGRSSTASTRLARRPEVICPDSARSDAQAVPPGPWEVTSAATVRSSSLISTCRCSSRLGMPAVLPSCRGRAARQAGAYWRHRARCAATGHGGHPDPARRRRPDGQQVRYRSRCQGCYDFSLNSPPGGSSLSQTATGPQGICSTAAPNSFATASRSRKRR